ncbi:histidine kinase, partial [Streptomyces sp. SR27]|nr:histidine kinase [Streptomyces sp. SR27]
PGSAAEANSNALPSRSRDPLVEAAERAFMEAEANAARERGEEPPEPAAEPTPEPEPERTYEPEQAPEQVYAPEPEQAYAPEPVSAYDPAPEAPVHDEPAPEASPALGESLSETTLQVRLPDPPPEPDTHERAADAGSAVTPDPVPEPAPEPEADQSVPGPRAAQWERVTDKGLPKRTPQVVRQAGATATPRTGGVDAEALRRRLGGFHQGAKAGRRDVEAELDTAGTEDVRTARTEEMSGDTVEEARS